MEKTRLTYVVQLCLSEVDKGKSMRVSVICRLLVNRDGSGSEEVVLASTWWYWVNVTLHCLILSGTGFV